MAEINAYRGTFKPSGPIVDLQSPIRNEAFRKNVKTPYARSIPSKDEINDILASTEKQEVRVDAKGYKYLGD